MKKRNKVVTTVYHKTATNGYLDWKSFALTTWKRGNVIWGYFALFSEEKKFPKEIKTCKIEVYVIFVCL